MDKQTAQQTLAQLNKSIEDAQRQAKELQAIIDRPDVSIVYQGRFLSVPKGQKEKAYYLDTAGSLVSSTNMLDPSHNSPNQQRINAGLAFSTIQEAEQYAKFLKVRQKARVAMATAWATKDPEWDDRADYKYCLTLDVGEGSVKVDAYRYKYTAIHFPSYLEAHAFLNTLSKEEAVMLLKEM